LVVVCECGIPLLRRLPTRDFATERGGNEEGNSDNEREHGRRDARAVRPLATRSHRRAFSCS
jgi:hypothetical protein